MARLTRQSKNRIPLPIKTGGKVDWPVQDVQLFEDQVLPDSPMVKREGVDILPLLTPEHVLEMRKCMMDPIYFVRTYCRIMTLDHGTQPFNLFDYQEEMIRTYVENRFSIACTARQMGKCVTGDTKVRIRQGDQGKPMELEIEYFYEWVRFCNWAHGRIS